MFVAARELLLPCMPDFDTDVSMRAFWKTSKPHSLISDLLLNLSAFSDRSVPLKLIAAVMDELPDGYRKEIMWKCADVWRATSDLLDYLPLAELYHRITANMSIKA